jgi:hypothetical protein
MCGLFLHIRHKSAALLKKESQRVALLRAPCVVPVKMSYPSGMALNGRDYQIL